MRLHRKERSPRTHLQAQFFNATLFGTDFRDLYQVARQEVFGELDNLSPSVNLSLTSAAQPIVGMFPPNSLLSAACAPKSFDFHTVTKSQLEEFSIPIQFVVHRTALIHGVSGCSSWRENTEAESTDCLLV